MSTPFDVDVFLEAVQDLGFSEDDFDWVTTGGYDTWEEVLEEHQAIDDPLLFLQLGTLATASMEEEGGAAEYDADDIGDDVFFHHGDLFVEGNLRVNAGFLVTGDLHVSGCIIDHGPESLVLVMGDINTTHLFTNGEFHVQGDIHAPGGVVYATQNRNTLEAETIYARLVIEDDHDVQAVIEAEYHFDINVDRYVIAEELEDILVPEVYDRDGLVDPKLMFDLIRSGEPIFLEEEES